MKMEIQDIYPLSPTQQGMLFHDVYSPDSGLYVERLRYTIHGELNVSAFKKAWQKIIDRHPILRSAFIWEDVDEPLQVVLNQVELPVEIHDWRSFSEKDKNENLENHLNALQHCIFELSRAPLMRLTLIRMADDVYEFIWSYHHLLLDGWSVSLVLSELIPLYESLCHNEPVTFEKRRPYRDYIAWLRQQDKSEAEAFWRQLLKGFTVPTPISVNGKPGSFSTADEDYAVRQIHFENEYAEKLQAFARQHRLTLNTIMQGAWAVLLSRYSGEEDVVFGAVVSGRPADLSGSDGMIGMFINTIPVRTQVKPGNTVLNWLNELQVQQLEARRFEYNPLVKVQEWSEIPRGLPMFESIMVFENPSMGVRLGTRDDSPEITYSVHYATATGYPLTIVVEPGPDGIEIGFTYDQQRFDEETIARMQEHFRNLLKVLIADPDQPIVKLPLLSEAEKQHIVVEWNDTRKVFEKDICLHQFFEDQVEKIPDAIALIFDSQKLTYRRLNELSNQMAHYLQSLGVGPEVRVGLCMERSPEMMIGILGILKAGGTYVPLDPAYPMERLAFMLEDIQAPILLTRKNSLERLTTTRKINNGQDILSHCQIIVVDEIREELTLRDNENPVSGVSVDNAAYIIYTSGSTGQPKGVIIPHHAICNHMLWMQDHFGFSGADRFFQKTAFSFDASITEFFAPFFAGGQLVMAQPGGHQDTAYLVETIICYGVSVLQLVPSLLRVLLDEPRFKECHSLKNIICAGEPLTLELQKRLFDMLDVRLHNLYGPTEAAIDVTFWPCENSENQFSIPIGKPLANTQIYLLDSLLQPVPVGVPGELYIGGDNLARGYLNQPGMTAEKFIPSPFIPPGKESDRLYRSGDLARFQADGNIEYLSRIDHQVKVRGFRIELGEIEAVLSQYPDIKESVVVVREEPSGYKRLIAYIVPREKAPSVSDLRNFLKKKLPDYMLPSTFVMLDALPRTTSGKIDRRWLPSPDEKRIGVDGGYIAPRTPVEKNLAEIWAQILGVKQVGIYDNFFELGGDSILSLQVVGKANQTGLRLTPRQIFQHPTIAELASVSETAPKIHAEQGLIAGEIPLTPVQHWFFEQNLANPHHFNHSIIMKVDKQPDISLLERVLHQVLIHHDALRIRFESQPSGWKQINDAIAEVVPIQKFDLSGLSDEEQTKSIEEISSKLQGNLNLTTGPVVQVAYFNLGEKNAGRLLFIIHHLVVDGVSWRILLEDLFTGYHQLLQGQKIKFPPKTTSFKYWAKKINEYAENTDGLQEELKYWLSNAPAEAKEIPADFPEGKQDNTVAAAGKELVSLSREETRMLLQEIPELFRTRINDVLLTALTQTFSNWTGERGVWVDLEGHGREPIFEEIDLSRTVGWFTSIFPVRLELMKNLTAVQSLKIIKEQLRRIPNKGIGFGILRYLSSDKEVIENLSRLPAREVSFNYLGQFDQIVPDTSGFSGATESTGPNHSPQNNRRYLIEIDAYVSGGQLRLEWKYGSKIHKPETVQKLAVEYLKNLQNLIKECRVAEEGIYTPSDFPLAQLNQSDLDRLAGNNPNIEDIYPLSAVQEGMLFHSLFSPQSGIYVTQVIYELEGLDIPVMKQAWQKIINRHPILRTGFIWKNLDKPLQIVYKQIDLPITEQDWRDLTPDERSARFDQFLKEDQDCGFEISEAPLMRITLFRTGEKTYRLVWTYHHLLLDGWSVPLLTKEFLEFYETLSGNQTLYPEPVKPYRNYIEWLHRQDLSLAEKYWRSVLSGISSPTPLGEQTVSVSRNGESHYQEMNSRLEENTTEALQSFSRKYQLTQNTLVQGAWALLLSHYSGEDDVIFGATLAGRPVGLPGADSMIGIFINTLPVRVQIQPEDSLLSWLSKIQERLVEIRQYENSPLNEVHRWSGIPSDKPLFESIVVFENFPVNGSDAYQNKSKGLRLEKTDFIIRNNFPLTLRAMPGSQLQLTVLFDTNRFEPQVIEKWISQLKLALQKMYSRPDMKVQELAALLVEVDRDYQRRKEEEFKQARMEKLKTIRRKTVDGEK